MSRRRARGFSLIELIVAFAILAFGLTLLLGSLSGASRQLREAGDAGRAALHAQSLLDARAAGPLEPGRDGGQLEDGRYRWTLEISPWQDPATPADRPRDPAGPRLLRLQLDVAWGDGGPRERVRIDTLRLVRPVALAVMPP